MTTAAGGAWSCDAACDAAVRRRPQTRSAANAMPSDRVVVTPAAASSAQTTSMLSCGTSSSATARIAVAHEVPIAHSAVYDTAEASAMTGEPLAAWS